MGCKVKGSRNHEKGLEEAQRSAVHWLKKRGCGKAGGGREKKHGARKVEGVREQRGTEKGGVRGME